MSIIGRQLEVGIGIEEVRGTAKAVAEKWVKNTTANIIAKAELVQDASVHNVLEDSDSRRVVNKWVEGDLEGNVHCDMIGYLFYNLYGAVVSSLVSGSVYSHAFSMLQSIQHPSLNLFVKDGAVQQKVINNVMLAKFSLKATVNDFVKYTASFMGKTEASNSDTPSYDTEYDFVGKEITIKIADSEAGLSGATATRVKELNIDWDCGLIKDLILGSYNPDDLLNAKLSIEGTIKKNFIDTTFKDLFLANTFKYMSITITGETAMTGSYYPTITILLNKVGVTDWSRGGGADELVSEDIKFKAYYNATDGESSTITVQNLTSEYDNPVSA